jgi:hypothetical protein
VAGLCAVGLGGQVETELPGGASPRRFFRVRFDDATRVRTGAQGCVALFLPPDQAVLAGARQSTGHGPFLTVRALLAEEGLPVPAVYGYAEAQALLFVEDLGDATLELHLKRAPDEREPLYRLALGQIARAQQALAPRLSGSIIATRRFDEALLRWEVEHFREWALVARGIALTPAASQVLDTAFAYLASTIASWPQGFVHRDYQSRNLMVKGPPGARTITWIDFQDAMLGPRVYDLVALLCDSYQPYSAAFVRGGLDEYASQMRLGASRAELAHEFDLVTAQRKLKDAGRFIYMDRVRGLPDYLPFVELSLTLARGALSRLEEHSPLRELARTLDDLLGPPSP